MPSISDCTSGAGRYLVAHRANVYFCYDFRLLALTGCLTSGVQVGLARQPTPADQPIVEQSLLGALRAVPGVTDAAFGGGLAQTDVRMGPFAVDRELPL